MNGKSAIAEDVNTLERPASGLVRRIIGFSMRNKMRIFWISLWLFGTLYLFICTFVNVMDSNLYKLGIGFPVARASAVALKFNIALVIILACRSFAHLLRTMWKGKLANIIALDDFIIAHKAIGYVIVLLTSVHVVAHFFNFAKLGSAPVELVNIALGTNRTQETRFTEAQLYTLLPGWTGIGMLLCMLVALPLASGYFRYKYYTLFQKSHLLLIIPFMVFLTIHGMFGLLRVDDPTSSWAWYIVPLVIYALERLSRAAFSRFAGTGNCVILKAHKITPDTIELCLSKPPQFEYQAGAYAFLKSREISGFEWHPFTILSAPEESTLRFAIKVRRGWTASLAKDLRLAIPLAASKHENNKPRQNTREEHASLECRALRIYGPFGSPVQSWRRYDTVIMVAAGIGATPYLSLLSHLLINDSNGVSQTTKSTAGCTERNGHAQTFSFIWVCSRNEDMRWTQAMLNDVHDRLPYVTVRIFLTKETSLPNCGNKFHTELGRPTLDDLLLKELSCASKTNIGDCEPSPEGESRSVKKSNSNKDEKHGLVGIFSTASPKMSKDIRRSAIEASLLCGKSRHVRFHPEIF